MGGFSSEFDISIKSGTVVYNQLLQSRYTPHRVIISKEKWVYLDQNNNEYPINKDDFTTTINDEKIEFDCVFNIIHGTPGEDGFIQAYFKLIHIPVTGCQMYQSALTFNKRDLISVLRPYGVLCADSYYLNKGDQIDEKAIVEKVGLPCFVKANKSGSSYGISKVYETNKLQEAIDVAFKEDDEILIESFLDGVEVSVGVVSYKGQTIVLPITEIVSENDFFDYEAKYLGKSDEITPARISEADAEAVRIEAKRIYEILKMNGFSRSEFIFHNGKPHFIEMNTVPGLSEESILPQQAQCAGISLVELFENVIDESLVQ